MEAVQVQPRQARIEISVAGDDEIDTRVCNTGAEGVRIGKRGCAVLRHPLHLIRHTTPLRTAIAKRAGWGTGSDFTGRLRNLANYLGSIHHAALTGVESARPDHSGRGMDRVAQSKL